MKYKYSRKDLKEILDIVIDWAVKCKTTEQFDFERVKFVSDKLLETKPKKAIKKKKIEKIVFHNGIEDVVFSNEEIFIIDKINELIKAHNEKL